MGVFLRLSFLAQISYIGNFVGHILVEIVSQIITLLFLSMVFTYTSEINGWTFDGSIFVYYLAIVVVLTAECFTASINSYYRILAQGRLDPFLTLPVERAKLMIFRWSEPGYLVPVVVLLAAWPLVDPNPHRPFLDWVVGSAMIGVGVTAILLTFAILSLATLVTQRLTPADFMVSELSRMLFLPIGVYPAGVWRFAVGVGFPMLFSASAAGAVLVAGSYAPAFALSLGTAGLAYLNRRLEAWLLRDYSYPGS